MNISEPCTLVLFDIDGTLVDARPQAGLAFEEAFESYFGIPRQAARSQSRGEQILRFLQMLDYNTLVERFSLMRLYH